jgi:hypothetical protein
MGTYATDTFVFPPTVGFDNTLPLAYTVHETRGGEA